MQPNHIQNKQMESWAEKRDSLLREISIYEIDLEAKKLATKEAVNAFNDAQNRISEIKGRLAEIDLLEERKKISISIDVAELIAQKSRLESEIETKNIEIKALDEKKKLLTETITEMISINDKVFDKISVMDQIVGHVKTVSDQNISDIKTIFNQLKTSSEQIIQINSDNASQTQIILDKLPRYIFELQKPIPIRRIIDRRPIDETTNIKEK